MQPSATQSCAALVQCLDLSRPESISTAGYCADVRTQATKYPQPMLYSAAKGALVTYEPPGKTGLQQLQYLDNISRPKHVTSKSPKAQHRCANSSSPERQRQQQQQPPAQQQAPTASATVLPPHAGEGRGGLAQQQQAQQQQAQQQQAQQQQAQQPEHLRGLPPEAVAAVERGTAKAERAAAAAAFTAACQWQRQLVSYQQSFSWGGRVKDKHSSLVRMNAGPQAIGSGAGQPPPLSQQDSTASSTSSKQATSSSATQLQPQAAGSRPTTAGGGSRTAQAAGSSSGTVTTTSSRASKRKELVDAEIAAAAAKLGAKADKLLALLERRRQEQQQHQRQQQNRASNKQRQGQQQKQHTAGRGSDLQQNMQDELLCSAGLEYLQL